MSDCIFCKIINGEAPSDFIYRDKEFVVFNDIKPSASIHILLVPIFFNRHINSIDYLEDEDKEMLGKLFLLAKKIAQDKGLDKTGYKLIFNVGRGGGQLVDHLHLHLLGGWEK